MTEALTPERIEELLARAEGLQRHIEDLKGLRDVVLEPVRDAYVAQIGITLTPEQERRYEALIDRRGAL